MNAIYPFKLPKRYFTRREHHTHRCAPYLLSKGIKTSPPSEHKKTFEHFRNLARAGVIRNDILKIYEQEYKKAETLLKIFKSEKGKRGHFIYQRIAQANKEPAEVSMKDSGIFFKHINKICER